MNDVWSLICDGRLDDAIMAADEAIADDEHSFQRGNKLLALLLQRNYDTAIVHAEDNIRIAAFESAFNFEFLGVAYWLVGRHEEAVDAWKRARQAKYVDAAGGLEPDLLLLYAAAVGGDHDLEKDAIREIRKRSRTKASRNWPGAIGAFILQQITESDLLAFASSSPPLAPKHLCQAHFYIGVVHLRSGDECGRLRAMQAACSQSSSSWLKAEYYLARGETDGGSEGRQ